MLYKDAWWPVVFFDFPLCDWTSVVNDLGSVDEKQALTRAYLLGPTIAAPEFSFSLQLVNYTEALKMKRGGRDERMAYLRKLAHLSALAVPATAKPKPGEPDRSNEKVEAWRSK